MREDATHLSIIIPTRDRHQQVAECIHAVEHNRAEIIVVNDAPGDMPLPEHVRVIRHDTARGRAAAVNTGLKAALHDLVLILNDDIYAAPDMVVRLRDEFTLWNNPHLAVAGRVVWDPEIRLTPTMRWLEDLGPFHELAGDHSGELSNLHTSNAILWRPFVLENGGFDENFIHSGLEDTELGLRLKKQGLEVRFLAPAVGYHNRVMCVRDLVHREIEEGMAAAYLHSKFPEYLPLVNEVEKIFGDSANEEQAAAAVEQIDAYESSTTRMPPPGISELFMLVYRHYFLQGVVKGLTARRAAFKAGRAAATLRVYNEASRLETMGELDEARRLFRLVRGRDDSEYWAGAHYHLGIIETLLGNEGEARGHFSDCLALAPEHDRARRALREDAPMEEEAVLQTS